jgi:ABC-type sugar transport system permease subunit
MSISTSSSQTTKPKMNSLLRGLLGLLLLFPACALCSSNLFLLSFNTLQGSFQKFSMQGSSEFIGLVNYQNLFENPAFMEALGFTALQIVVRVLAVAILPLLLAQAVNTIGKKLGLGIRLLFTLPLAFFGPALVMYGPAYMRDLWGRASIKGTFLLLDGIASLAVACATWVDHLFRRPAWRE